MEVGVSHVRIFQWLRYFIGAILFIFVLLFLWKGGFFGTELEKISNVFDKQDVSSELKEPGGADDNLKQEAVDESQSNKNNYQCVRYSWSGGEKQVKQEFAVFSGKYYFLLSVEGSDGKSEEVMTFLGDRERLYLWMYDADPIDLVKRGKIFDLKQMYALYGVDISEKILSTEDESILTENLFYCSPVKEETKLKFVIPDLSEIEFNAATWEDQESLFAYNEEKLGVDFLLTWISAIYQNGAYKSQFEAQVSTACINFMGVCFHKNHLQFKDLQNLKMKKDYSLIDEQSFTVLSENCGPDGEGDFYIKMKGKDRAKGSNAICDGGGRSTFFPDLPRNKWLNTDQTPQSINSSFLDSSTLGQDRSSFNGLSADEDAQIVKLEGSYRCLSEDLDSFAQHKNAVFISDGRIMVESVFSTEKNMAIHRLIYTNGKAYYFDASNKPVDDGIYVWDFDFLWERYGVDLRSVDYVRRYIHSTLGYTNHYSCATWQINDEVFVIPSSLNERPNDYPTYMGNEGRLFNF